MKKSNWSKNVEPEKVSVREYDCAIVPVAERRLRKSDERNILESRFSRNGRIEVYRGCEYDQRGKRSMICK